MEFELLECDLRRIKEGSDMRSKGVRNGVRQLRRLTCTV